MADYRAYLIGMAGRFVKAIELHCPDDASASEAAKQLVDGHDVELWDRDRIVARFNRQPEP